MLRSHAGEKSDQLHHFVRQRLRLLFPILGGGVLAGQSFIPLLQPLSLVNERVSI